ncbi:unnamed protein product [Rhizopus microsporus]
MLNTNEAIFIIILMFILILILVGLFILMNRINKKRQELVDIEQRLTETKDEKPIKPVEPAIIKDNIYFQPVLSTAPPVMTPQKKTIKKSILHKIYSFRNPSRSPPLKPCRPSSMRLPSFLPMQEDISIHPPPYQDSISYQKH